MKMIVKTIFVGLTLYILVFVLYCLLIIGCVTNSDVHEQNWKDCGNNSFTRMIHTTHEAVFLLFYDLQSYKEGKNSQSTVN